jgi:PST family polysaccharide transporter
VKRPLRNLVAFLAGDLGSRLIGFFITAYLARVLDTAGFGLINIGFSVLGYLMLLGTPGIHLIETRNAAAADGASPERVQAIVSLRALLAGVLIAGTAVVTHALPLDAQARMVVLFSVASLLPLALSLDWFFHGKEQFNLMSTAKVLSAACYGIAVIVLVHSPEEILWVPIAFALGNAAASVLFLRRYRKQFGTMRLSWQPALWKTILRSNVPVGLSVFLAQSTVNLPPIVVGWLVSNADAGVFSAALKVVFVLLMLDRILHALFLPVATRYFTSRDAQAVRLLQTVVKATLALLLPVTMCAVLLAPTAIEMIFGQRYAEAAPLLQILLGYFFLTVLNTVFVCVLVGSGHEKEYTVAVNVGSGVLVLAILVGTLLFGSTGTAVAIVAGELLIVTLMARSVARIVNVSLFRSLAAPAGAAFVMLAGIALTLSQHLVVQLVAGVALFVAAAIALRVLEKEEIRFLLERFV